VVGDENTYRMRTSYVVIRTTIAKKYAMPSPTVATAALNVDLIVGLPGASKSGLELNHA
jgi:hypothetical protein